VEAREVLKSKMVKEERKKKKTMVGMRRIRRQGTSEV